MKVFNKELWEERIKDINKGVCEAIIKYNVSKKNSTYMKEKTQLCKKEDC